MSEEQNKGPVDTIRDGNLKANIWERKSEKGPFYATEFARTYEDAEGKLRDSHSFSGADLLRIGKLSGKAYDRTNELRREHKQSREEFQTKRQPQTSPNQKREERNR